jgi:hypothetical protein
MMSAWLSARPRPGAAGPAPHGASGRHALNGAAGDVAGYNLERKPFVFNVFAWLAEAERG